MPLLLWVICSDSPYLSISYMCHNSFTPSHLDHPISALPYVLEGICYSSSGYGKLVYTGEAMRCWYDFTVMYHNDSKKGGFKPKTREVVR